MKRMCYIVKMNSALDGLFEQLDDYGFDYECEGLVPDYVEICVDCYSSEIRDLENIFAPYV